MKICFFLDDITKVGGIERVTSTLVAQLSNHADVDIVSIFKGHEQPHYMFDNINIHYLTNVAHGNKPHSIKRLINLLSKIYIVKRFFKHHHYDIIVAQSFPPAIAMFFSGVDKSTIIAAEHVYAEYYGTFFRWFRNFIYRRFAKVVVLTNNDKNFFDNYLNPDQTVVIPNPINALTIYRSTLESNRIISAGRLVYQKGYDTLISCFKTIHEKHPGWTLDIFGDGPLKTKLHSQIISLGLSDNIRLRGITDNIYAEFRGSAFYVMSSHFEGFPMVLVEAMSQGLPCISFDCPNGPSDIIKMGDNGLLIDDQNKDALVDAILYMIENPEVRIRMGVNANNSVEQYSSEVISNKWLLLFKSIKS